MSNFQQEYLRKRKRYGAAITLCQILLLVFFIFIWEFTARTGLLNDFIFSSPSRMLKALVKMLSTGEIIRHTLITLAETLASFLFVIGGGLLTAVVMWTVKPFSDIMEPYIVTLNSLPKSALAPVLIVWLGTGYKTIIVTAVSVSVFGTILSLYTSFMETSPEKIKLITTLGGGKKDILLKLILPGSIPSIISCMKVNIGLCLVGVIIAEFLVAGAGLGYVIIYNSQIFKMDYVLLSICVLCLMAALLYKGINIFEKHYTRAQ
ncbi:MAG: ABC transporter permease [Alistipes sp.]|nr:ABC transporter permease [Alistipes sp.]